MSLIGYRLEGIFKNAFVKGKEVVDALRICAHFEDYQKIIATRGGAYGILKKICLSESRLYLNNPFIKSFKPFLQRVKVIMMGFFDHKRELYA